MPPPCHRANTPGACGAAEINDSVNGTLRLVMDMLLPARSKCILRLQFACRPRCATYVAAFRQAGNGTAFQPLTVAQKLGTAVAETCPSRTWKKARRPCR